MFSSEKFQYNLIDLSFSMQSPEVNDVREYWFDFWTKTYQAAESDFEVTYGEFDRQDFLATITSGDDFVATHLYSAWDLNSSEDVGHHYFKFFNQEFISKAKSSGARRVVSWEYLTVNERYRKKKLGLSMADVICQCAAYFTKEFGFDAAIAPCRKDFGVDKIAERLGYETICPNVITRNIEVDLMIGHKNKLRDNIENHDVVDFAKSLWNRKTITMKEVA